MRQQVFIILGLMLLTILLIGLNAATFVQKEKRPDTELTPNRSTYNSGSTGTRVFYDLLAETGRKPRRWQEPISALSANYENSPSTFVIIGQTRREFTDREIEQLLSWVSDGNKLVIIDREPPAELIKSTANWSVSVISAKSGQISGVNPSDPNQMTDKTPVAKPVQPTVFTAKVNAVQSSKLASGVEIERFADEESVNIYPTVEKLTSGGTTQLPTDKPANADSTRQIPVKPQVEPEQSGEDAKIEKPTLSAPVIHLADSEKNFLVDFPFGSGQIVFLTDPYIISNGGINLVDNAQLGINIVAAAADGGIIAFDEYHQGYGSNNNRFLEYFEGTPLIAFFLQFAVIVGLIMIAQSLRFARPLPERAPDRLSKLEYVSAMAELQQRTKAFDLAIENIYTDFRRRAAKHLGVDNYTVTHDDLAKIIAARTNEAAGEIENLLFKCEEIVRGEPTDKKEVLQLTRELRRIEEKLGVQRRKRTDKIV